MYIPSTTRQIRIVAALFDRQTTPGVRPEDLDQPWRDYYEKIQGWLEETEPDHERYFRYRSDWLSHLLRGREETDNLALILEALGNPVEYLPASQMLPSLPDLEWLWPGWIPRGLWSLLAAVPGTGKSYVALDIAHRICAGSRWPDGAPIEAPGNVLWVDAENIPSVFKQRLSVWSQSEQDRLYLMLADLERWFINLDDFEDRDRLFDMVWSVQPALIVVDSYGAVSLKGENTKEDVQVLLSLLNKVAVDFNCGLLVVHHLRKAPSGQQSFAPLSLDAVRGSSHIVAMARSVLGLQWIPTDAEADPNGPRKLWCLKNNLARFPDPLGVYFEPHSDDSSIASVSYGDSPTLYKEPTKTEECSDWILQTIRERDEPVRPAELVDLAEKAGYSRGLVYRARKALGDLVVDTEGRRNPKNAWALPEMEYGND